MEDDTCAWHVAHATEADQATKPSYGVRCILAPGLAAGSLAGALNAPPPSRHCNRYTSVDLLSAETAADRVTCARYR
jgi:hypothetical protein